MSTGNLDCPVRRRDFAVALACVFALALAACQHTPPPSNATPGKAVATNLRLIATGDLDGLMKNRLPTADYSGWRAEWGNQHAHPVPASVAQEKQFAEIMQMLTEPGAEAKLAKRMQPELTRLHGDNNEPMPILGGILEASLKQMIADSPQLGPAQRTLATQGLDALLAWAKTVDFSDTKKAKKAIALVCATARQLHVQTLAQWRALDYAATMKNYGILWNGMESLLNIYGLDLAGSLNDTKVTAVSNDGTHATVRLDLNLAGKDLNGEWPMQKRDDHWYDTALLQAWQQAHPAGATTAAIPAPAGTSVSSASALPAPAIATPSTSAQPAAPAASAAPASPRPQQRIPDFFLAACGRPRDSSHSGL